MTIWYYDKPVHDIVAFYDRHLRLWTVYPVDDEGNQLCEAQYTNDKNYIKVLAEEFKEGNK